MKRGTKIHNALRRGILEHSVGLSPLFKAFSWDYLCTERTEAASISLFTNNVGENFHKVVVQKPFVHKQHLLVDTESLTGQRQEQFFNMNSVLNAAGGIFTKLQRELSFKNSRLKVAEHFQDFAIRKVETDVESSLMELEEINLNQAKNSNPLSYMAELSNDLEYISFTDSDTTFFGLFPWNFFNRFLKISKLLSLSLVIFHFLN